MTPHRWSGWPGAWCLDCGAGDARESCVAMHDVALSCAEGHLLCLEGHSPAFCPEHVNLGCQEPGSRRHDPYGRKP